ncbi:MAG: TonB-dependent siderophore receptor [Phenylobacterium sp.]|uniref:TonB-dependent siderophore receptor n=1 Tax=Phenylobacterium sp. TaxID=1871053 RepID=UPI0025DDA4B9|nr:TonB-dependent siderophore receptor [Phenylobacterium sp.]MCG9915138.1 TonB-dependent siderophore receptor [Phenylobacterium sp.]
MRIRQFGAMALLGTTCLAFPGVGLADQSVDEVIVTGQRQAYRAGVPLQDVPQSITVIEAAALDQAGLTKLSDALDLSASVVRQNNFGGLWDSFAVRGFAGDENLPSGYLVNGFNAGRGFGGPRDVAGIERVEVLKGPNAAVFGRGEPGGSVNLVTKQPSFAPAGSVNVRIGEFELYRGEVDWTGPLVDDRLAVRLIGFAEEAGSFRDTVQSQRHGIYPSVLLRFNDSTSLTYELEATRQEVPFDRGVVSIAGNLDALPASRFLGEPGDGPLRAEVLGHQLQLQHDFSQDWSLLLGAGWRETDLKGSSSEPELAASRQRLFVDGRTLSRQFRFRDYEAEHLVARAELAGRFEAFGGLHRVLIGADWDAFDNSQYFLRFRPPAVSGNPTAQQGYVLDVFAPVYGRFPAPTAPVQTNRLDEQRAFGVYVQDQIRFGERLEVRIGGRFDSFEQTSTNRANGAVSSFDDTRFSPQVGAVFHATPQISLYGAYGEGFRQNFGATAGGTPFEPETSRSTEVGIRAGFGGLTGTFAVFALEKTNVLASDPANAGFSIAIGEVESRGFEADVTGRLPGDIDLWVSYAYTDAEVSKAVIDAGTGLMISPGDRLLNIPEQSLSVQATKLVQLADTQLRLGGGIQHVGTRLGETGARFELPAHTLARLFVNWEITEQVEVSAYLNNVFDETWYANSYSRLWLQPGAPRTASVSVRYRF